MSSGTSTSRFKDFYDVRELSRKVPFVGAAVAEAFRATFSQRGTELPAVVPESFLSGFAQIGETGWKHFLKKLATTDAQSFAEMVAEIEPFVMKTSAMARGGESELDWMPGRGWSSLGCSL
ncbi:nucleotidyl transferase AbiEii/AbiGii toxin family protein [Bradyrhizobium sp. CCBAU 53421]|uniref:nucleotidyl transferase AbiEii/AbiGii toxin family protein n=1 Tax=Bradyrhizobium sp. CCBAU 53421 TaxID=1325120 RepID=UPI00188C6543|nr:nucleotidyl transferase AbiEii/AbiGii toxin family protein [Bradyrhizobium sp. CCBAU 53421]